MENTDINQSTTFQPIQPVESIRPVKKDKNIFKFLFIISIVVLLCVIIICYFVLNKKINSLSQTEISTTNNATTETLTTVVTSTKSKESTLTELNDEYNLYTNYKYGFTLKVPKGILNYDGCQKKENYYVASSGITPIIFFENKDTLYLTTEYTYELTNKVQNIQYGYNNCQKIIATLDYLVANDSFRAVYPQTKLTVRKFYFTKASNDEEINQFIKLKFGSDCKLGEKVSSGKNGIFKISISAEPNSTDESNINFAPNCYIGGTNSFYNSTNGSLVIFHFGVEDLFRKTSSGDWYDLEMVDSLSFF